MFGSQREAQDQRRALSGQITSLDGIDLNTLLASLIVLPGMPGDMPCGSVTAPEPQEKLPKASEPVGKKAKPTQDTTKQEKMT